MIMKTSKSPELTMRKTMTTLSAAVVVPDIPDRFLCPLSLTIMNDPVVTPYGDNFERRTLEKYLKKKGEVCPITDKPLKQSDLISNSKLQWEVLYWKRQASSSSPPMSPIEKSSSDPSPLRSNTFTPRRNSMVRQDSPVDSAPRRPQRKNRCDKTLCLDLSEHDTKPSVPRRKNSDHDISKTFMLACQLSLEASCGPGFPSNSKSSCDSMQSMVLSDFMNSFAMGRDLRDEQQLPYDETLRRSDPTSILAVLDEVEQAISLDLFA